MWKPHTVSILYLIENFFLLFIFQTLFTANRPFFDNFDQSLLLVKLQKQIAKKLSKFNYKLILGRIRVKPSSDLTKNAVCTKIVKKWTICSKQSLKND